MEKPHISLCMIVKNEEDCIARCLDSVKDVVDEIIIVDTGSTDKTIEICQLYNAQIERYEWNGSFADARNFCLEKATGEWLLWLDADEELDETDRQKLRDETQFADYDVLTIYLINYLGDKLDKNNTSNIAHTRLCRNNGIRFINKIHECLDTDHVPQERIGHLNVKVHHYGYLSSVIKKKKKTKRNIDMLLHQIEDEENIAWALYNIALEYFNIQQYQDALKHTNLSILAFLANKALPPSMVYNLKYAVLIAMGKLDEAIVSIDKAIALYPDYVDLQFYKGMILYHFEKYEASILCFKECLKLGEENKNYLIQNGRGSFQAWYCIGLCQQKLNNKDEAILSILNSLLIVPQYNEALETLATFFKEEEIHLQEYLQRHFQGEELQTLRKVVPKLG